MTQTIAETRRLHMILAENLTKYYQDFCAVDQINFRIERGEIVGLLGPNGAGKTTTLRMLTGYFSPTAGDIRVKDLSVRKDLLKIKQLMGYLPESAPLYQGMLVYDYLDYIARIRGLRGNAREKRLSKLAEICGLNGIMHNAIHELSKGLKQRVGLAHAMMVDPEILVLDEPTSGLDPNQIVEIRDIIRKIGEEKTVILSTHILSEVEAVCDRVIIINRGSIVADDRTENLKQQFSGDRLVHMTLAGADYDEIRLTLSAVPGVTDIRNLESENGDEIRITLSVQGPDDLRGTIYQTVRETPWTLLSYYQDAKNLESIFQELTREN
jgi:ABC-2 type transport system ATP-binding protein